MRVLTFREMIDKIRSGLTQTLAATEVGRLLQLFSAAGVEGAEKPSSNQKTLRRGTERQAWIAVHIVPNESVELHEAITGPE